MAIIKRLYLAYLLRIWQVKVAGQLVWRASLEDPHTGERRGFPNLDALIAFLLEQVHHRQPEGEASQEHGCGE
jgi:hypothetical protein